jgi:BMFP domain-containing protein YqiC
LSPWKDSTEKPAIYHCISRVVVRHFEFKIADKRYFSKRREKLMNSQLLDATSFAHEIESLFRQIWTTWINSTTD